MIDHTSIMTNFQDDISNLDWLEVQSKLIDSQKEVQLCLHKENLTELGKF